jgi:uridine kinase
LDRSLTPLHLAPSALSKAIESLPLLRSFTFIGIGGFGAAGKTTIARSLSNAQVIATDEFWNGSQFDLNRLHAEVFVPLALEQSCSFLSFDWATKSQRGMRVIEPVGLIVIEGVCALHQMFRDSYDFRVWVDAPPNVRLTRAIDRDGEAARSQWTEVWMPNEYAYVERDRPIEAADVIIDSHYQEPAPEFNGTPTAS